jgi:hypothetical protein
LDDDCDDENWLQKRVFNEVAEMPGEARRSSEKREDMPTEIPGRFFRKGKQNRSPNASGGYVRDEFSSGYTS